MAKACAYLCRQCCFIDGFGEFSVMTPYFQVSLSQNNLLAYPTWYASNSGAICVICLLTYRLRQCNSTSQKSKQITKYIPGCPWIFKICFVKFCFIV